MAYTKAQLRTLHLLVSAILLLCTAKATRFLTTEKDDILRESDILTQKSTWHKFPTSGPKTEQHADQGPEMSDFEENCKNVDEEEECLIRRTLTAHMDYIYTQRHNP